MPLRTCVGCRAVRPQAALIRIARDLAGVPRLAPRRWTGRGAYLCRSLACLERALQRKALPRALRIETPGLEPDGLVRAMRQVLEQGDPPAGGRGTAGDPGGSARGGPGGL